jgi:hypothetical protein
MASARIFGRKYGVAHSCYPLARLAISVDKPLANIRFEEHPNIELNMTPVLQRLRATTYGTERVHLP